MRRLVVFLVALISAQAQANGPLAIAIIKNTPDQTATTALLTAIYAEAGLSVEFIPLPGKRALIESSSGRVDGEAQRIFEIGVEYPSLVRVPTSFISWQFTAFSKQPNAVFDSWHSLKDQNVAMVRGIKYAELGLESAKVKNVSVVSDLVEMLSFLEAGFVDVAISSEFNGRLQIARRGYKNIHIHTPPIGELKLFHYLHQKNAKHVPKLNQAIIKLKQQGQLAVIRQQMVEELMTRAKLERKTQISLKADLRY